MTVSTTARKERLAHPGQFVRHRGIHPPGRSIALAAAVLGATRATLPPRFGERACPSPEMAVRIEEAFGGLMDAPVRLPNVDDAARTREGLEHIDVARLDAAEPVAVRA